MNRIPESELILRPDGSIYHLALKPGDVAHTILTVGDPGRVERVSRHFDTLEVSVQHREFITHTGWYKGKRFTAVSTGIGTDNIDIIVNELDALVNIDFGSRKIKSEVTQLSFVRVGTCGGMQQHLEVDRFLVTEKAIGFDNLIRFYGNTNFLDEDFSEALVEQLNWDERNSIPYVVAADAALLKLFDSEGFTKGITLTNVGFYGPQGRKLRLALADNDMKSNLEAFRFQGKSIDNLEMESSALYGLARLLGHRAISVSAVLANRASGTFSKNPTEAIDQLIKKTLDLLVS